MKHAKDQQAQQDATGASGIRQQYQTHGVDAFYAEQGAHYRNPHEAALGVALRHVAARCPLDLTKVLDLACGSGEATLALRALGAVAVDGVDPFTADAYLVRTGQTALGHSFADIAAGALAGRTYSLVVCSFALHLAPKSRLPAVLFALAQIAPTLLVLTPHKRPTIAPEWGWHVHSEFVVERVRARYYTRH